MSPWQGNMRMQRSATSWHPQANPRTSVGSRKKYIPWIVVPRMTFVAACARRRGAFSDADFLPPNGRQGSALSLRIPMTMSLCTEQWLTECTIAKAPATNGFRKQFPSTSSCTERPTPSRTHHSQLRLTTRLSSFKPATQIHNSSKTPLTFSQLLPHWCSFCRFRPSRGGLHD